VPTCTTCSQEIPAASAFCSHCGSPNPETSGEKGDSDTEVLQRRLQAALGDAFTVEGSLGEGGFAVVFAVFDRKLSRRIAVKVLRPELTASRASKQRFVREAETVARLNHPHILPIFFVGEGQGLVYFGMPLIAGETLEAKLRREGRLPETEVARIGAEIADALAEAHAAGLVHRDIKPLNVMLQGSKARVLVADFGIAKAAAGSGEDKLTGTGIAIGSPHYMSPEQASGDEQVDHRSDIYSLGILVWQMLAGDPPFVSGGSRAVIMQQVSRDVPPIRSVRPDVSAAMASIVARCVTKPRDERYQSAEDVAQALRALTTGAGAAHATQARTTRAPWMVPAALGGLAIVALAAWLAGRGRAGPAASRATAEGQGATTESVTVAPASSAPTIAVLPFSTVGASDTAQFGRSAALMLGEALALRNGVGTVDGNSLLSRWIADRRSTTAPLDSNARFAYGMGANQMVIGNYVESGRTFRLSLALYDTHDVARLWTGEVTGSTDSLFALLDRLATRVAVALCAQPSYNPGNICYDTPARPRTALALSAEGPDTGGPLGFYAHVSADGEVNDVRLATTNGDDERVTNALGLLRDARFDPARRGGRPVAAWASVEVGQRAASSAGARAPATTCGSAAYAVKNVNHECYDTRPVPRVAPVASVPGSCGAAPQPANVLVHVADAGATEGEPSVTHSSGCAGFDTAALAAARTITFVPASKGGHAVPSWVVLQIRPVAATGGR
jgi:tRNA A-37 threonylcarbamoyl transferase component Bud32/TolB-like protein